MTESMLLSVAGGVAGLAVAWWGRESLLRLVTADGSRVPLVQSLLFGVEGAEPATLIAAMMVMTSVGIVAAVGPALRAAQVEPAVSLRHE